MKTASEMTYTVSSGALYSTPTNQPSVSSIVANFLTLNSSKKQQRRAPHANIPAGSVEVFDACAPLGVGRTVDFCVADSDPFRVVHGSILCDPTRPNQILTLANIITLLLLLIRFRHLSARP